MARTFPTKPTPRHLRPRAAARPKNPKYAARFYDSIPIAPPTDNDRDAAARYARALAQLCDDDADRHDDDPKKLTRAERASLIRLHNRWDRRALGLDARWLIAGAKTGRLRKTTEALYRKPPDPAWKDPI